MPVRDLIVGYAMLLSLVLAGTLVIQSKNHGHGLRGLRQLSWGLVFALIGLLFMALRSVLPVAAVSVAGQSSFLIGAAFLYSALARVTERPSRLFPFFAVLLPVFAACLFYFSAVDDNLDVRIAITCIGYALMLAWTAVLVAPSAQPGSLLPLRWMFRLLVFLSALRMVRMTVMLIFDPHPNLNVLDPIQDILIYATVLGALAEVVGIFWLSVCARREEDSIRADTDGLTGLLNRRAFEESLADSLEHRSPQMAEISLLLVDLDFFKNINDELGHLAGDTVLRRVGTALRRSVRSADVLARFGGDEFAVLLCSPESGQGMQVAERVHHNLLHMRHLPGDRKLTASLGVATALPGDTPLLLIERADRALYRSKNGGRNRLTHFDQDDPAASGAPLTSALIQ